MSKLGSKCIIIADGALQKGLPLAQTKKKKEQSSEGAERKVEPEREEGNQEKEEEECGVEGLSCGALTMENTLSSTKEKANHLRGRFA